MSSDFPKLTLVLGGANSGKSAYAEALCIAAGLQKTYIATAQSFDDEMAAKIKHHQITRGDGWHTRECPLDFATQLGAGITLVDCLTMWISNHLMAQTTPDADAAIASLDAHHAPVVCVSNETGLGVVPDNALARRFRTLQGRINQQMAARADLVIFVAAGLPMVLKGTLPKGMP
ncbi:adenosylcobinamide kinase/adenosylcobinamide phosphate guanyltransferase [Amylibacter marinus]|uniref:Bifunctional adenosylcobalamin biosynthesis protein n=1 Tax=Amylibacter marinus TaxID=1475483 RepID=A0ABQ5VUB5_9RHOB|nr:bifunctional adenosylcobinamide kinase/adenosylcobinamide-phosphate guanylyltransferase [Amylibacter marinus]GLQ34996.1 adenosylcobinamide kinase/adenosylcobinamide phosphate guanyltransferase [Amylibacter marinus]